MTPTIADSAALTSRILLALLFLISGYGKVTGFDGTTGYIASKGLPLAQVATIIAIVVELGIGVLLVVGYKARWAALTLAIYAMATALLFHDFWNADAAAKVLESIQFWKNVSICGGLLMVFAFGPGRISLDGSIPSSNRHPSTLAV